MNTAIDNSKELENLRNEFKTLRNNSGLTFEEFNSRCAVIIANENVLKTPEGWVMAARMLTAQLSKEASAKLVSVPADPNTAPTVEVTPVQTEPAYTKKRVLPIKSSLLIYYSISVEGDVSYARLDEDTSREETETGAHNLEVVKTTKKTVRNEEEYVKAMYNAGQMRSMLRKVGNAFSSGVLLVPLDKEEELDEIEKQVRAIAREHNAVAKNHTILPTIIRAAIMASEEEGVARRLTYDMQQILDEMKRAIDSCDVKRIREVALTAKAKASILPAGSMSGVLAAAINDARKAARTINSEVVKKGRTIEEVKKELNTTTVESARMMFLEYDVPEEVSTKSTVDNTRFAELEI